MNSLYRSKRVSKLNRRHALTSGAGRQVRTCVEPLENRTLLSASIQVGDLTSGAASHPVVVTYTDAEGIDVSTLDSTDLAVSGPKSVSVTLVNTTGSGSEITATYELAGPDGAWDTADNGVYSLSIAADAVKDAAGNNLDAPAAGSFTTNIAPPPPADTTPPTVKLNKDKITARNGGFVVEFADAAGMDPASLSGGNITLTRGQDSMQFAASAPGSSPNLLTQAYSRAGGAELTQVQNGTWTVSIPAGASSDVNGNPSPAATFIITIDVPGPESTFDWDEITAPAPSVPVTVTYRSDFGINLSTIGVDDLNTGSVTVSAATVKSATPDRKEVVVEYTLVGPGGSWDVTDGIAGHGADYEISAASNAVKDDAGNTVWFLGGYVGVSIPDTVAPTAAISPIADITTAGASTFDIIVTYTDNAEVRLDLGLDNIVVTRNGSSTPLTVTKAEFTGSNSDKKVGSVKYTVAAPGGSFDASDNGVYTVTVIANSVTDTKDQGVAAVSSTFNVNIADVPPPVDAAPVATISVNDIATAGSATHTITVVYTDSDGKIRNNTIGTDDIVVTRDGAALNVVSVDTTSSDGGSTITAVYTIAAPGGSFGPSANGTYTVSLAAGAVTDNKGDGVAAASKSFSVNIGVGSSDNTAPVVSGISAGNVTSAGVTSQVVTVTYTDDEGLDLSTLGTDDLTVTGPAGTLAVNVVNVASSNNGKSATVSYTFAAPEGGFTSAHNGAYTISLDAGAVTDSSGNAVASAGGGFSVNVPVPTPIDPGFGSGNAVITSFTAEALTTTSTGKVIVAGRNSSGAVLEVRKADGSLDLTFNKTGQLLSTTDTAYYAVVSQGNKIVVAGTIDGDFVLVRYNADGKIDTSFGTAGRMVVDFGQPNDAVYALAIAPDGKLVAAGQSDGNFAFARFMPDGALDPSFAQGGKQMFDLGGMDLAGAVVVQPDGKIVAAGTTGNQISVVRLRADGEADADFSGDGLLMVAGLTARNDPAIQDRSAALALQADGKILIGNHTATGDFGVARITGAGNVDSSFGNNGIATADFGGDDDADVILVQPTGEILVLGTSLSGSTGSTTLAALDSSGKLIDAFGAGGKLTLDSGIVDSARELHIGDLVLRAFGTRQADGRVVVGSTNSAPNAPQQANQSALRRLNVPGARSTPSGSQIGSFGVINGKNQKLTFTDADGTKITFTIKGGIGTAYIGDDGKINLVLTDGGVGGATVSAKGRGGDNRIALGDVSANGTVKALSAKNGDLSGTFCVSGAIGKLTLGNVSGDICSAGSIKSVAVASLSNAKLLAGSNLGADAEFGGTGADTDAYGAASIGSLKVAGQIIGSTIGSGIDPVDATFLDEDDRLVGAAVESFIKSISAKGADEASRFLSGSFGKVKLGAKVTPTADARFRVLQ